jgi:site-specific DNA recombinase
MGMYSSTPKCRAVGVLRLSVETEESTSIEKQKEIVNAWGLIHDTEIIGWAIDEGVSGATSPFEREGLGEWLTDEKALEYDILVGWKIDRFGRETREFLQLVDWLHSRKKDIAITDINIDTTTPGGKMIITILAAYAEWERSMIADRVRSTHKHLRTQGRLSSGKGYWWTTKVKRDSGWYLENVLDRVKFMREYLIDPRLDGKSLNKLGRATGLNPSRIAVLLRPETLMGWKVYTAEDQKRGQYRVARTADGEPVKYTDPIITETEYHKLKAMSGQKDMVTEGSTERLMLRSMVRCGSCLRTYVKTKSTRRGVTSTGYQHAQHECGIGRPAVASHSLDQFIGGVFLDATGAKPVVQKVFVPGNDVSEDLVRVNRNIEDLREEYDLGLYDGDREGYLKRLKRFADRKKELESTPARHDTWELLPTGQTYADWWDSASDEERNQALKDLDLQVLMFLQDEQPVIEGLPLTGNSVMIAQVPPPSKANRSYKNRWIVASWRKPQEAYSNPWDNLSSDEIKATVNEGRSADNHILDPFDFSIQDEVQAILRRKFNPGL